MCAEAAGASERRTASNRNVSAKESVMAESNLTLSFEGVEIRVIDRHGRRWITQTDLAKCLYSIKGGPQSEASLATSVKRLRQLFNRNSDEFTPAMTALFIVETAGGPQEIRIYSARGAHLMGMFAKTPNAKRWRIWALDKLDDATEPAIQVDQPENFVAEPVNTR